MVDEIQYPIEIDLNQFKLHIDIENKIELTLLFDSPSRKFYLCLIAFVVNQMKKLGKVTSILLQEHLELIVLLNKTVGSSAGSSEKENLLTRIYRKWKDALPNLEEAPLFRILGRKKEYGEGIAKTYQLSEAEKDRVAYRMMGRYDKAVEQAREAVKRDPKRDLNHIALASACISAGLQEEARAAAAEVLKINPKFSLDQYAKALPSMDKSRIDRRIDALRKAGLK